MPPSFDPAQTAIVEGEPAGEPFTPGDVQVDSYTANKIELRTHSEDDAFLVAADTWYPGWQATIDGQSARLYIADVAFRGLRVPAGDHRIEMRFTPKHPLALGRGLGIDAARSIVGFPAQG